MFALRTRGLCCLALLAVLASACSISNRHDGVANKWRTVVPKSLKKGVTTEAQVLDALGPPTRILALKDRTVFYYLLEHAYSEGLNLVVYRQTDTDVRYDRAVFFFNDKGRLQCYSFSQEVVDRDE